MTDDNKSSPLNNRWAILSIYIGFAVGVISAVICLRWYLVIFGFNIMYIVSPLLAGFVENYVATKKYGKSTGAISALLTFILINLYGWILPGWIFPKEPATLSLITIIALVLTIQAAFPIFVNHVLLVVVPGIFAKFMGRLVRTPSEIIRETSPEIGGETTKQADEIFLDEVTIPIVSVPEVNSEKIKSYVGLVVGEAISAENESEGRFSTIVKIIEPAQLDDFNLGAARKEALSRMLENAKSMGANGVVEVSIDLVSMGGLQGSVLIVTATGTAVIFEEESNFDENTVRENSIPKNDFSVVNKPVYSEDGVLSGAIPAEDSGSEETVLSKESVIIDSDDNKSITEGYSKINENINDNMRSDDLSIEISQFVREENARLTKKLELATKNYPNEELEQRFLKASKDLKRSKTE